MANEEKGVLSCPYAEGSYQKPDRYRESAFRVPSLDTIEQRHVFADGFRYGYDKTMGRHMASAVLETLANSRDAFRQPLMIADAAHRLAMNSDDERWCSVIAHGMNMFNAMSDELAKEVLDSVSFDGHHGDWPLMPRVDESMSFGARVPDLGCFIDGVEYVSLPSEALGAAIARAARPEWRGGIRHRLEQIDTAFQERETRRAIRHIAKTSFRGTELEPKPAERTLQSMIDVMAHL